LKRIITILSCVAIIITTTSCSQNKNEGANIMSDPAKKITTTPESYTPKDKPEIISMTEQLCAEKVIDTIVIEGVEFTIIEKAKTLYAGNYAIAQDLNSEPNFNENGTFQANDDWQVIAALKDSVTPERILVLSIDYATDKRPCAMLRGQETTSYEQPDGIHIIEAEPTLLIKVNATDESWALTKKLTGMDNPEWHMSPLFGLIRTIFCTDEYGYEFNGCKQNGNEEIEHYYFNGNKHVTVPVVKKEI